MVYADAANILADMQEEDNWFDAATGSVVTRGLVHFPHYLHRFEVDAGRFPDRSSAGFLPLPLQLILQGSCCQRIKSVLARCSVIAGVHHNRICSRQLSPPCNGGKARTNLRRETLATVLGSLGALF